MLKPIMRVLQEFKNELKAFYRRQKVTPHRLPVISHPSSVSRITTLFLTLTLLLPTVSPYGKALANNNGPNAPEAASFEPVDATDMVNLLTGDFTYVLPLMNVPSPEGGYPIALAYHAGIAMDQEASWVGLGWNLNPGAIDRSVNGYPDDYNSSSLFEYLYDEGKTDTFNSITLGYSLGVSVGVGASWGSNQSLGGHVSIGTGISDVVGVNASVGTSGSSVGVTIGLPGELSLGVEVDTNGTVSTSIGVQFDKNGAGFRIGASTDGVGSFAFTAADDSGNKATLGVNLSSQGVGYSLSVSQKTAIQGSNGKNLRSSGGIGIGGNRNFNNTVSQGDFTVNQSAVTIPIILPTPIGIFSLSFGSQKVKYFAAKRKQNTVSGPLYFHENFRNNGVAYRVKCFQYHSFGPNGGACLENINTLTYSEVERNAIVAQYSNDCKECEISTENIDRDSFMDIYEIPLDQNNQYADNYNIWDNNPVFPSYDKYNVQAQGLGGSIHAKLVDAGMLFGHSDKKNKDDLEIKYALNGANRNNIPSHLRFHRKPIFTFDNEVKQYLNPGKVNFDDIDVAIHHTKLEDTYNNKSGISVDYSKKSGNHVDYYTNKEILEHNTQGLIQSYNLGFERSRAPKDGIGAFVITAPDGKSYHYTLPVYNHETITRTYGISPFHPGAGEYKSYYEKRQLEPYATHWLLTAVTGPDYVDNGNGIADAEDLGYWVSFEYGLWSDSYAWRWPYGKDFLVDPENPEIKTWTKGRKDQYFLNKVKTRTHTALFLKNEREDNRSPYWKYESVPHIEGGKLPNGRIVSGHDYKKRFEIHGQKTLRLDKVILVKSKDDVSNLNLSNYTPSTVHIHYPNSPKDNTTGNYNLKNNVFDWSDNWEALKSKAIKVICMDYKTTNNSLVRGTPGTGADGEGRLTLSAVRFGGKQDATVMPPYRFDYINDNNYRYNNNDANEWGYKYDDPSMWSLREITTPQGGKIQVDYEQHDFKTLADQQFTVTNRDTYSLDFDLDSSYNLRVGDKVHIEMHYAHLYDIYNGSGPSPPTYKIDFRTYNDNSTITRIIPKEGSKVSVNVTLDRDIHVFTQGKVGEAKKNKDRREIIATFNIDASVVHRKGGGIRTKSISIISDTGNVHSKSNYKYGKNKDGIGWVSYIPSAPDVQKEIPYSTELPAPKPIYEYVTHEVVNPSTNQIYNETTYQYHVMNEKSNIGVRYGDLYEFKVLEQKDSSKQTRAVRIKSSYPVPITTTTITNKSLNIDVYQIKDNLNCLGQLLSITNKNGEGQVLNKVVNTYFEPGEIEDNLGVTQESYQSYKSTEKGPYKLVGTFEREETIEQRQLVNTSTRIKYPNLLKSSTEYKNGVSYTTEFKNFDPISGQAKEIYSYSSRGLEVKSVSEPAFRKYPQMGSKADNPNNKNMLSQGAITWTSFKKLPSNDWKLIDAEVQTWNNSNYNTTRKKVETRMREVRLPFGKTKIVPYNVIVDEGYTENVWRKHKSYVWKGDLNEDGSFKFNSATSDFLWNNHTESERRGWQKVSEITKYSNWSQPLETMDINGNKASTKMGDNYSKIWAVCNAPYGAMFYASFENKNELEGNNADAAGGMVVNQDGEITSSRNHSGQYCLKASANKNALWVRTLEHDKYKASVWVHKANYQNAVIKTIPSNKIWNFNPNEKVEAGDWILLNFYIDIDDDDRFTVLTSNSGDVYYDDFRMHPVESSMTSYVYNQWDELTFIMGPNNMTTCFLYDAAGRIQSTYIETPKNSVSNGGFVRISENKINYKR